MYLFFKSMRTDFLDLWTLVCGGIIVPTVDRKKTGFCSNRGIDKFVNSIQVYAYLVAQNFALDVLALDKDCAQSF
jgi:hypothetical protein